MAQFIEVKDSASGVPVAINIDTISRVYSKKPGIVTLVMTTTIESEYNDIDSVTGETTDAVTMVCAVSERIDATGDYVETMKKIAAASK